MKKCGCLFVFLFILTSYNLIAISSFANNQEVSLTKIGEFATGALYYHIDVIDDILYFTEFDTKKFCLLDVQDPSKPVSLANYSVTDGHDFEIKENIAYLSTWEYGMEIVNISNPNYPTKISEYSPGSISHLKAIDNYIYVSRHTMDKSYYEIIDVSNPELPKKLKDFCEGQGAKPFIKNDLAFFCVKNFTSLQCYFRVFDISDLENPELISEYISSEDIYCYDIFVENNYAYFALAGNGLMIMDYSNISNPVEVLSYENGNDIWRLHVEEDILFMSNDIAGIEILDVTDKTNPIVLASFYDGGSSYSFVVIDNLIYVADSNDAIEILEIEGLGTETTSGFLLTSTIVGISSILILQRKKKFKKKSIKNSHK